MLDKYMSDNLESLAQMRQIALGFFLRGADTAIEVVEDIEGLNDGKKTALKNTDTETIKAMKEVAKMVNDDECDEKKFTDAWKVVKEAGFNVQWDVFMQEVALPMAKLIKERGGADGERTGK